MTSVTYTEINKADRDSHEEVAITETGVIKYTILVLIGHQFLCDIMIVNENDLEIEMITVPFSTFSTIKAIMPVLYAYLQVPIMFKAVLHLPIALLYC